MGSSSPSAGKPRIPALFTTPQSPGKRRKHKDGTHQENNSVRITHMSWMVTPDLNRDELKMHIFHSLTSHYHLPISQKPGHGWKCTQDFTLEMSHTPKPWCSQQREDAPAKLLHQDLHCKGGEKKLYLHFAPSLRLSDRPPGPEWCW